jgi:hypothetical protein
MLFFFILNSCSKNGVFQSPSNKIIGTWKIEKVKFLKDFSFSRTDETENYNQINYTFNDDESLAISSPGVTLNGTWNIQESYDPNVQNNYGTGCTLVSVVNNSNGTVLIQNWNNLYIHKSKLTGEERRNGGTYYFTLSKQ